MVQLIQFMLMLVISSVRSRLSLQAENAALRNQLSLYNTRRHLSASRAHLFGWPEFAENRQDKRSFSTGLMINARSETAWRNPSFRHAMQQRRAIIPVNGFYEWQRRDGAKKPYYITGDDRVLAVAGLYAIDENGNMRCCVLTRRANEAVQPMHDRMPVTVSPGSVEPWLNGDRETVDALIETSYRQARNLREVSSFVNNSRNDGPECMAPPGGNGQLF